MASPPLECFFLGLSTDTDGTRSEHQAICYYAAPNMLPGEPRPLIDLLQANQPRISRHRRCESGLYCQLSLGQLSCDTSWSLPHALRLGHLSHAQRPVPPSCRPPCGAAPQPASLRRHRVSSVQNGPAPLHPRPAKVSVHSPRPFRSALNRIVTRTIVPRLGQCSRFHSRVSFLLGNVGYWDWFPLPKARRDSTGSLSKW